MCVRVNVAPQSIVNSTNSTDWIFIGAQKKKTPAFREHDDMTGEKLNAQCFSTLSYRRQKCQDLGLISQRHAHCSNASPAHKSINALIKHISYWIFFQYCSCEKRPNPIVTLLNDCATISNLTAISLKFMDLLKLQHCIRTSKGTACSWKYTLLFTEYTVLRISTLKS